MKTLNVWRAWFAYFLLPAMIVAFSGTPAPAQPGEVKMEVIEYKGWKRNLRLSNGKVELIVTLDVGPRIISYRMLDSKNVLKEYEDQLGKSGEDKWMIRGGHRLWTAPEDLTRTYSLDNSPFEYKELGKGKVLFSPAPEKKYGIQKELEVTLPGEGSQVTITHRIKNIGTKPTELAIWALTVMAPGGLEIIPLEPKGPHPGPPEMAKSPEEYAPNLSMVFWPYFDFKDKRCTLGTKFITLKQNPKAKGPIKFGLLHLLGWVAYLNNGTLFVKHIPYHKGEKYPDRGCNYETFTNADMLEMEGLGPLKKLTAGEHTELTETWNLLAGIPAVTTEQDIETHIVPKIKKQ